MIIRGATNVCYDRAASDPQYSYVTLLAHMDGTDGSTTFVDQKSHTMTAAGNAHIETDDSKFGGASGYFDGSGDRVSVDSSTDFYFAGDFTIEAWVKLTSYAVYRTVVADWTASAYPFIFGFDGSGVSKLFAAGAIRLDGTTTLSTGTWTHIAWVRSGSTVKYFQGGTQYGSNTYATAIGVVTGNPVYIGAADTSSNHPWLGYIDDLRITNGVARYSSTFTPPAAAFPNA